MLLSSHQPPNAGSLLGHLFDVSVATSTNGGQIIISPNKRVVACVSPSKRFYRTYSNPSKLRDHGMVTCTTCGQLNSDGLFRCVKCGAML